jgi:hypothetical protein
VCLRSLGLIDEDSFATETLVRLAKNPDQRAEVLADILRSRFPDLVALNGSATRGQLEDIMAGYGLSNADTRRKAMGFYVAAATYAGFTLSPHLRPSKPGGAPRPSGGQAMRPARKARKRVAASARPAALVPPPDEMADMRRTYFDLLISKAKDSTSDEAVSIHGWRVIGRQASAGSGGSQGFPSSAARMASRARRPWFLAESR